MVITQQEHDKNKKKKIEIKEAKSEQTKVTDEIYGIIPSDSHYGAYYLLTGKKDDLKCSCPSRTVCKHLREIKNGNRACLRVAGCNKKENT